MLLPDTPLAGDRRIGRAIEGCRWRQAPRALNVAVERVLAADLGELGTYFPDFLLVGPVKKVVVEVKPYQRARNDRNKPSLACAEQLLREKGCRFVVATEKQIRRGKRHERASVLLRHARSHISKGITERIIAVASHSPKGIKIRDLACETSTSVETVLHLVGRRHLRINKAFDFDEDQLVYPTEGSHVDLHA